MSYAPYSFEQVQPTRYIFFSLGKHRIEKVADFIPLKTKNIVNLGFGDLLPDGSVDDRVSSNNGDIRKVLSTVIHILNHFTTMHPELHVFFSGSTDEWTLAPTSNIWLF